MPKTPGLPFSGGNGEITAPSTRLKLKPSALSDEELISASRADKNTETENANYISELISRYMRIIIIKANKNRKTKKIKPDKEDLISEGFLGLLSAIRAFDSNKGSFSSFANKCIDNKIKSALTLSKSEPLTDDNFDLSGLKDTSPGADELLIEKESENELSVQLKKILSELEFNVLNLYINSYSYSRISEKLGITLKSVDNTLTRARSKLKKIL